MKYTRAEQETIIRWDNESTACVVYTNDQRIIKRMDSLVADGRAMLVADNGTDKTYTTSKRFVKINAPRILSEEQKKARSDAARKNFHGIPPKTP